MLTYKHLLPQGMAGRKESDFAVKKSKRKKSKGGKAEFDAELKAAPPFGDPRGYQGPDPVTIQILTESTFLPRRASGISDREFPLKSQTSLPENQSILRSTSSTTLGMGGLNYAPLKLGRVYGRTDHIPVLNLTGIHKSHIVYAASNVLVYFDYYHNYQSMLQGHKNKITCLTKDQDNKYLASGDVGRESLVIIWDIRTGYPVKKIGVSDEGVIALGFVGNEDYIGTIGTEKVRDEREEGLVEEQRQVINIWFFGSRQVRHHRHRRIPEGMPIVSVVIPASVDKQREITFYQERPEYFVSTGDKGLVFYTWVNNNIDLKAESRIICHVPKTPKKFMSRMKGFVTSLFCSGDRCLTACSGGYVLEFGTMTPLGLQDPPNPDHNIKEYKRAYKIGDTGLTALTSYKEFFLTGDHEGNVKFFDQKFRIVRWTKTGYTNSITSIALNLMESQPDWKIEMQSHYEAEPEGGVHAQRDGISVVRDYTFGGEKYKQPSQTTIERQPLFAPDLVVGYAGGNTYYYHLAEGRVDQLIHGTLGAIVALDTCPNTTHVTMSNKKGEIQMYDFMTQTLLYSGKLFKKAIEITYLKFHPSGSFAFFGTNCGHMYFRRAYTWKSMDSPLDAGQARIQKIVFASSGAFVAHYDVAFSVTLYYFHTRRTTWLLKGKHRSHFRPIVDMSFVHDFNLGAQRLFSLGQDRRLVEYDIVNSSAGGGLKILNIAYVEQSCIPTSLVFDSPWPQHGPMIMLANNINKIKIFDQNVRKIRRTCQGPNYGAPVNRMISISPEASEGRGTRFILMILGNKIGLMKTPIDGNPYKFMAILGHSNNILEAAIGCTGREIFTCGEGDNCAFMWRPNVQSLETCTLSGGSGITPYKQLLDAGLPPDKSVSEDVENIFYHLMLKRSSCQRNMLNMSLTIPISEIPTVLRTCGFFPSEFEIDIILDEAEFLGGMKLGEKPTEISFEDFIVLFANHRTFPISDQDITNAFQRLGMYNEEDDLFISRDEFVNLLTKKGEVLNALDLPVFLPTFYRSKEEVTMFGPGIEKPAWFHLTEGRKSNGSSTSAFPSETPSVIGADPGPSPRSIEPGMANMLDGDNKSEKTGSEVRFRKPGVNPKVPVITMTPSSHSKSQFESTGEGCSEGLFGSSYPSLPHDIELPEEISAKFFIKELLTPESRDTINWNQPKDDEEAHLHQLYDELVDKNSWDEILQRWKGRDEWRYFNRVFGQFRHDEFPLKRKLKAAIEMDHYCRTGTWPEPRKPKEDLEEEETEEEGETDEDEEEEEEETPTTSDRTSTAPKTVESTAESTDQKPASPSASKKDQDPTPTDPIAEEARRESVKKRRISVKKALREGRQSLVYEDEDDGEDWEWSDESELVGELDLDDFELIPIIREQDKSWLDPAGPPKERRKVRPEESQDDSTLDEVPADVLDTSELTEEGYSPPPSDPPITSPSPKSAEDETPPEPPIPVPAPVGSKEVQLIDEESEGNLEE